MSVPVDVLAVMDEVAGKIWRADDSDPILALADESRAAVAELIEAAEGYAEAEAALANRELAGINAEKQEKLLRRINGAREYFDAALALVKGGAQ